MSVLFERKIRRSRADEALPPADRWLLSWSDFVTLLLALFAAMYAGASVDLAKAKQVARSVSAAMGAKELPAAPLAEPDLAAIDTATEARARSADGLAPDRRDARGSEAAIRELAEALRAAMAGIVVDERVRITQDPAGVGIDIDATLLFASATARLAPQADAALRSLAGVLLRWPCQITVEGHTDSLPIHSAQFGSNWELSAMRAAIVARRLSEHGIASERLSAVGRADSRPLGANDTVAGRAGNRRVHLLVALLPRS